MLNQVEQNILDCICERVTEKAFHGYHGQNVGKSLDMVPYIARKFGKADVEVDAKIGRLIDERYLSAFRDDDYCHTGYLRLTARGWEAFSKFRAQAHMLRVTSSPNDKPEGVLQRWRDMEYIALMPIKDDWWPEPVALTSRHPLPLQETLDH